ncbi:MAG TPA: cell division ATP-binding protein FtsE, partial [Peptococcaceae bacterium]|nr:cell division ATP-binding protein FtsE [Peptococcaceae bacterium]
GGQKQRVAIARSLVNNPSLIFADEPTGNLDIDTSWGIMDCFRDINEQGTTVIIATHAKEIVDVMRQRVIAMNCGQVVRDEQRGVYANAT